MEKQKLVTLCIPHYNNKVTIRDTLDSLLGQTYENILIKVFDNVSTDGSFEILKEYEKKHINIQVFQNSTNIGGEANFTKCIENLEGKYGAIFHADDVYSKNIVKKQVSFLEKYSNCSAVATHAYIIDENSNSTGYRPIPQEYEEEEFNVIGNQLSLLQSVVKNGNFITCPSVMARVDIYREKVKFWNGEQFQTSADLDVWMRLALYGDFGFISIPLMSYRESLVSYSYKDMRKRITENNMFLVIDFYMQKYKNVVTKLDKDRYDFLLFKDNLNRTINEVVQGIKGDLELPIFKMSIIKIAFSSKSNFKIYLVSLFFKILRNFTISKNLQDKIFYYRFRGQKK